MPGSKNIALILTVFAPVILLNSCKTNIRTGAEMIAYIDNPKNGLKISNEIGKVDATMNYRPWQLIMLSQPRVKSTSIASQQSNVSKKYYFVLSLSANHKELLRQLQFSDYSEMVQVLAFRMVDYVSAVPDNGKPITPDDCLFEQTYGMSSSNQLLIIFDQSKFNKPNEIDIKVKEFGLKIGNLNYRFKLDDINNLQDIKLIN